jgi:lipid-binding SYLF domain-containing protein
MPAVRTSFAVALVLLPLAAAPLRAGDRELRTVESASEAIHEFGGIPLRGIPESLLQDAAGVAIVPQVRKAVLVVDRETGRGVILSHDPDSRWGNPLFVTLKGHGIGGEVGLEKTDLVLVFKTRKSLDSALQGKLTLGGDVAVAARPLGRETEVASDRRLKADVYSYSRSRGLFLGVSLEGARLTMDECANEEFYYVRGGRAADVMSLRGVPLSAPAEALKAQLTALCLPASPPTPAVIVVPTQPTFPRWFPEW